MLHEAHQEAVEFGDRAMLEEYSGRVIFHKTRSFARAQFQVFMFIARCVVHFVVDDHEVRSPVWS
jgi:hypothetical protein